MGGSVGGCGAGDYDAQREAIGRPREEQVASVFGFSVAGVSCSPVGYLLM